MPANKIKKQPSPLAVPLNFLLGCSEQALGNFELARLGAVADLRKEMLAVLDRWIEQTALAVVATWFKQSDREAINKALAIEEDPVAWAERMIRENGRSEAELIPLPSLPPGAAHLAAALRYTERNIAQGKCGVCPEPLDRNSVRYCTRHLAVSRARKKPKGAKGEPPGSIGWLYEGEFESGKGRQPGNLAALAMGREQRTRALLAELGIPPESAAVSLKAATEALLAHMPESKARAKSTDELIVVAMIPSRRTAQEALNGLLSAGRIERVGKGAKGDPFRFFTSTREKQASKRKVFGKSIDTQVG